jgi:outer membrane protein assembly factor BamB
MRSPFLLALFCGALLSAEDWNRFRGPNGSGIVTGNAAYPAAFEKPVWRSPVRPGKSSPVLTAKHVFVTAFEDDKLFTQCFERSSGKLLWERFVEKTRSEQVNALNHPAALSPVTDGENVYAFFKDFGLVSYSASGKLRWKTPLGPFTNVMGLGASPLISGGNVILNIDQVEDSYIAAFDRNNGEMRWKSARQEPDSWGSPLVYQGSVITVARGLVGAHLASNGKRILSFPGMPPSVVASPILDGDTVYFFGYGTEAPTPFASRLARLDKNKDGQLSPDEYGDDAYTRGVGKYKGNRDGIVTEAEWNGRQLESIGLNALMAIQLVPGAKPGELSARELWRYEKNFSYIVPALLLYNGALYSIKNGGILTTFDPATGKVLKTGRISPQATGGYSAAPVAADGKIYLANEDGKLVVLKASGTDWDLLSMKELDEAIYATPALSQGSLYIRTGKALYKF